jgi:hypothetical protein
VEDAAAQKLIAPRATSRRGLDSKRQAYRCTFGVNTALAYNPASSQYELRQDSMSPYPISTEMQEAVAIYQFSYTLISAARREESITIIRIERHYK